MPNLVPPKIPDGEKVDFDVSTDTEEFNSTQYHIITTCREHEGMKICHDWLYIVYLKMECLAVCKQFYVYMPCHK